MEILITAMSRGPLNSLRFILDIAERLHISRHYMPHSLMVLLQRNKKLASYNIIINNVIYLFAQAALRNSISNSYV